MGKPRLESVNDVVELVVESPAWNKKECNEKQLEEMDPTFRNAMDTHFKSSLVLFREELEEAFRLFDREGDGQIETQVEHLRCKTSIRGNDKIWKIQPLKGLTTC